MMQWATGATQKVRYSFSKLFVRDLDAMARFYEDVFGLVRVLRHKSNLLGRAIEEISFQATHEGGGTFEIITYLDGSGPDGGTVQGFITEDLEALLSRARIAGGTTPGEIKHYPEQGLRLAFVVDPEGHILEIVQLAAR